MSNGWIKLHRQLLNHWTAQEPEAMAVWVRILMLANHGPQTKIFNSCVVKINRGQLIYGRKKFSIASGVSEMKLRRILKHLADDGMINQLVTSRYSVIPVLSYDQYQDINQPVTSKQPASNQPVTTLEECKELKNEKKEPKTLMSDKSDDTIQQVFNHWKLVMGKTDQTKLTNDRKSKINARLKEGYSVHQLQQAAIGCSLSTWHMGQNDGARKHNSIDLIYRNGSKVEEFADMVNVIPQRINDEINNRPNRNLSAVGRVDAACARRKAQRELNGNFMEKDVTDIRAQVD